MALYVPGRGYVGHTGRSYTAVSTPAGRKTPPPKPITTAQRRAMARQNAGYQRIGTIADWRATAPQGGGGGGYGGSFGRAIQRGRGGGGGGRGGGGGGGGRDFAAEEEKRRAAMRAAFDAAMKAITQQLWQQTKGINSLRDKSLEAIKGYHGDYNKHLKQIMAEQSQASKAAGANLGALGSQVARGFDSHANPILADLRAQGVGVGELSASMRTDKDRALAQQGAASTFNQQLQQAATAGHADFRALGSSTRQAGLGMAQNERQAALNTLNSEYNKALMDLRLQKAQVA